MVYSGRTSSVISALTRIFRYLKNKIDLAVFQKGEGTSLKSENV